MDTTSLGDYDGEGCERTWPEQKEFFWQANLVKFLPRLGLRFCLMSRIHSDGAGGTVHLDVSGIS